MSEMGLLAALLSRSGEDISERLLRMIRASSTSIGDCYGFATHDGSIILPNLPDGLEISSDAMLGYKLFKTMPLDGPQPINQHGYSMILEGRLWDGLTPSDLEEAAEELSHEPLEGLKKLIEFREGSFVAAILMEDRILIGRDPIGLVPVYYGDSGSLIAAASNRKMLWRIGMEGQPLPPGHIAEMSREGVHLMEVKTLRKPKTGGMSLEDSAMELDRLMMDAVERRSRGLTRAFLGFSGGIDSSLLAYYLDLSGVRVHLICVGLEASDDVRFAMEVAEELGLPITLISIDEGRVKEDLDDVLLSVESYNPLQIAVGLPLYWAVKAAVELGGRVFFSGCGSDELFGGYEKYVRRGISRDASMEMMFRDVVNAHKANYERDYKICADLEVELRAPFTDLKLTEFGLSLPPELRLPQEGTTLRKPLLRALARRLDLPGSVINRQKRAVQYSTGVAVALRKISRREGRSISRYLMERFERLKEIFFNQDLKIKT
ncbi:MAG: asparagine synthetase B [Candidatus Bathyarchaeia archaeon]